MHQPVTCPLRQVLLFVLLLLQLQFHYVTLYTSCPCYFIHLLCGFKQKQKLWELYSCLFFLLLLTFFITNNNRKKRKKMKCVALRLLSTQRNENFLFHLSSLTHSRPNVNYWEITFLSNKTSVAKNISFWKLFL